MRLLERAPSTYIDPGIAAVGVVIVLQLFLLFLRRLAKLMGGLVWFIFLPLSFVQIAFPKWTDLAGQVTGKAA
jgi:hypothetical protein